MRVVELLGKVNEALQVLETTNERISELTISTDCCRVDITKIKKHVDKIDRSAKNYVDTEIDKISRSRF